MSIIVEDVFEYLDVKIWHGCPKHVIAFENGPVSKDNMTKLLAKISALHGEFWKITKISYEYYDMGCNIAVDWDWKL